MTTTTMQLTMMILATSTSRTITTTEAFTQPLGVVPSLSVAPSRLTQAWPPRIRQGPSLVATSPIGDNELDALDLLGLSSDPDSTKAVPLETLNVSSLETLTPPAAGAGAGADAVATTTTSPSIKKYIPVIILILYGLVDRISSTTTTATATTAAATATATSSPQDAVTLTSAVSAAALRAPTAQANGSRTSWLSSPAIICLPHLILLTWRTRASIAQSASFFAAWYMTQVNTKPLITKAITSGIISFLGDSIAQTLERKWAADKLCSNAHTHEHASHIHIPKYDRRRVTSSVINGLLVCGPLLHIAYEWLDRLVPVSAFPSASHAAITQVLIDDIFIDAIFVCIIYVATGLAEGYPPRTILRQLKKDYVPTVKTSWTTSAFLIPVEFVIFRFLPLSLRVLGMNFIDIIWDAMVSYMTHRNRKKKHRHGAVDGANAAATAPEATLALMH